MSRFDFNDDYLARLRAKDPEIWDHFDGFFRPKIKAKFRARFPLGLVDDLTSETILAVFTRIKAGQPQDSACLAGYVFSICHNKALEAWRVREKENLADFDPSQLKAPGKSPQQESVDKEEAAKVDRVLGKLAAKDRNVLIDLCYYGSDRGEVCRKYGVERDQLKMILFHARKRFQREWNRD